MAVPTARMRALWSVARRTLPDAVAMLETRARTVTDSVYVAMDAGRSPGKELAVQVLADDMCIPAAEAGRLLQDRLERAGQVGVPVILAAVVPREVLLTSLTGVSIQLRMVRRWLRTKTKMPPAQCRVVAIAGDRLEMDVLSVEHAEAR